MLSQIKRHISPRVKQVVRNLRGAAQYAKLSYSQEGEDILLARLFNDGRPGTYVDVGAHHPFRFSNTYLFYKMGWRGINIDAAPGSMKKFKWHRPRDLNLETGISIEDKELEFFYFAEPALNTFSVDLATSRERAGYPISRRCIVKCEPLSTVLRQRGYSVTGGNSFLTVDVEGLDLEVLRSNDWRVYRPSMIVAEVLATDVEGIMTSEVARYLRRQGYIPYSKLGASVIFKSDDFTLKH